MEVVLALGKDSGGVGTALAASELMRLAKMPSIFCSTCAMRLTNTLGELWGLVWPASYEGPRTLLFRRGISAQTHSLFAAEHLMACQHSTQEFMPNEVPLTRAWLRAWQAPRLQTSAALASLGRPRRGRPVGRRISTVFHCREWGRKSEETERKSDRR